MSNNNNLPIDIQYKKMLDWLIRNNCNIPLTIFNDSIEYSNLEKDLG